MKALETWMITSGRRYTGGRAELSSCLPAEVAVEEKRHHIVVQDRLSRRITFSFLHLCCIGENNKNVCTMKNTTNNEKEDIKKPPLKVAQLYRTESYLRNYDCITYILC